MSLKIYALLLSLYVMLLVIFTIPTLMITGAAILVLIAVGLWKYALEPILFIIAFLGVLAGSMIVGAFQLIFNRG